ncbi:hypothetical protein BAT_0750 [Bacillus pumilus ATCC 7061]|nr:hypothetical protein BAT_0750 [Bacillus pumilus ATCC 7061]
MPPFVIGSLLSYGRGQANMTATFIQWTSLLMKIRGSLSTDFTVRLYE